MNMMVKLENIQQSAALPEKSLKSGFTKRT